MPAPWPNATEEETLAYEAATKLADSEFENIIVKQAGPTVRKYVNASKANFLPVGDWNLKGLYRPPNAEMSDFERLRYEPIISEMREKGLGTEFAEDEVYAVGSSGAQPETYAHEFKHRQFEHEGRTFNLGPSEESSVRTWAAFRASTPREWYKAVRANLRSGESLRDTEQRLQKKFKNYSFRRHLLEAEAKAREEHGDAPKRRGMLGMFDSLYKDQEEALERRQQNWSLDKYIAQQELTKGIK